MTCFSPDVGMNSSGHGGATQPVLVRNWMRGKEELEERHQLLSRDNWTLGWCFWIVRGSWTLTLRSAPGVSEIHFEEFNRAGEKV